jgi:hypothetical protein
MDIEKNKKINYGFKYIMVANVFTLLDLGRSANLISEGVLTSKISHGLSASEDKSSNIF